MPILLREGHFLVAGPACYEIISVGYRTITATIVAGGTATDDRYVVWAIPQVEAAIRLGDMRLVARRPAWAGTPQDGENGRKKRARAHGQDRLV